MKTMYFKVCIVIIYSLFLGSCGKEANESDGQQNFYGYEVENKKGFDMASISRQGYNGDTVLLTGFRNEKMWIGFFDEKSKRQMSEWNGSESINRTLKIDLGYGEYKIFEITNFRLEGLCRTAWGYVAGLSYIHGIGDNLLTSDDVYSKDIVLLNGSKLFIHHTRYYNDLNVNWFQGSIMCNSIVLSREGEVLATLKEVPDKKYYLSLILVSYTEDIAMIQTHIHPANEDFELYTRIRKRDHAAAKTVWSTNIPSLKNLQIDARVNTTILEQGNPIWKYQIDVMNRDGSKQQVVFTVNVETGELKEN